MKRILFVLLITLLSLGLASCSLIPGHDSGKAQKSLLELLDQFGSPKMLDDKFEEPSGKFTYGTGAIGFTIPSDRRYDDEMYLMVGGKGEMFMIEIWYEGERNRMLIFNIEITYTNLETKEYYNFEFNLPRQEDVIWEMRDYEFLELISKLSIKDAYQILVEYRIP